MKMKLKKLAMIAYALTTLLFLAQFPALYSAQGNCILSNSEVFRKKYYITNFL